MSSWAAAGLNRLAPPSACFTSWLWLGWLVSFQGAVGAYLTARMLSTIELLDELDELEELAEFDAFRDAFGSVPVPPKKDWYHPRSVLAPMDPTTRNPPSFRDLSPSRHSASRAAYRGLRAAQNQPAWNSARMAFGDWLATAPLVSDICC